MAETQCQLARYPSEKSEWHWRFTVLKAEILHRQGLDAQALTLLKPDLPPVLATTDVAVRRKLAQAMASAFTQQLGDADAFLAEAKDLAQAHAPEFLGEVHLKKGTVAFFRGDLATAESEYQEALKLARADKNQFLEAAALEGLGVVATKNEHYDQSIDWDQAALQVARSVGAQQSIAQTLGNMAWCYRKLGQYDSSLRLYQEAEEASKRTGAIGDQIYWLASIANVYSEEYDSVQAEPVLQQSLDLARRQDDKDTVAVCLNDLSEIALDTGRLELAQKYENEADEVERTGSNRAELLQSRLMRARINESERHWATAESGFRSVISDSSADSSQKWEAEAHLAKVYADASQTEKAEKEFRHSLDTIETVRSSVRNEELRLSFLSSPISFYGDYIDFLIARNRVREALQIAELSRARTLAEGLMPGTKVSFVPTDLRPQQIATRSHAIVLLYWIGDQHSYLWVVTPSQVSYFGLPSRAEIAPLVSAYRDAIAEGKDVLSSDRDNGEKLYRMLVEPAQNLLSKASRVIVLPGETLYGLNFETLIVPRPRPHFWIEDVTLSTANSLALLSTTSKTNSQQEATLLLIGNPEPPSQDFPALGQGAAEVRAVSAHFPAARRELVLGARATPAAYANANPERFTYLHFVAHAIASRTQPLDSAAILSGPTSSYKLYAREIVAHPLRARLVTISACNGAGTRAYAGEGLVGLAWAFLRAGARNVIASLWEVSDSPSTTRLMDGLYEGLNHGDDPAAALRKAKLRILHSNEGLAFRKPFYWGPFQLYTVL